MKKLFSFLFLITITFTSIWSLPGFESYLPDTSGEYVYYKDNTFNRESYLGILYYDESTIQVRYYAPVDPVQKLPENEVSLLLSINPDSPHMEMTGERIISSITPNSDDVTIVNYLHDILYEFSAHRIKVDDVSDRNVAVYQNFSQFGGNVEITYDCTIPLFNIREIKKSDGTKLLTCYTTGQLVNELDRSFDTFKAFPKDTYKKGWKHYMWSRSVEQTFENQSVTLDKKWEPLMENMWALDDDAMLSLSSIPPVSTDKKATENFLIRFLVKGKQGAYLKYDTLKINTDNNKIKISVETYNPENQKTAINNIIILERDDSDYMDMLNLVTFKQPWLNNKKYFEKLLDSYKN